MTNLQSSKLVLQQLDKKIQGLPPMQGVMPAKGWIGVIRKTLNMSLRQLGNRMSITPQSVRDLEKREEEKTVTLKALSEAAEALDMILVYGFIPKDGSLEKFIERRAYEKAREIVSRTSTTMKLEDQENTTARLEQAVAELADEFKRKISKALWD
jgi:predicted DNA-binding mobile mystery protein A